MKTSPASAEAWLKNPDNLNDHAGQFVALRGDLLIDSDVSRKALHERIHDRDDVRSLLVTQIDAEAVTCAATHDDGRIRCNLPPHHAGMHRGNGTRWISVEGDALDAVAVGFRFPAAIEAVKQLWFQKTGGTIRWDMRDDDGYSGIDIVDVVFHVDDFCCQRNLSMAYTDEDEDNALDVVEEAVSAYEAALVVEFLRQKPGSR